MGDFHGAGEWPMISGRMNAIDDSSPVADSLLAAKRNAAIHLAELLLETCRDREPKSWWHPFEILADLLRANRLTDAIELARTLSGVSERARLPTWTVSADLAGSLCTSVARIRTHLDYGDRREALSFPEQVPPIESKGRVGTSRRSVLDSLRRHPIDDDSGFTGILREAEELARMRMQDSPLQGRMGMCRVFWATKKAILKQRFHIDWQTPAELNPGMIFD